MSDTPETAPETVAEPAAAPVAPPSALEIAEAALAQIEAQSGASVPAVTKTEPGADPSREGARVVTEWWERFV